LARAILVTADYEHWSEAKRNAVLAHEETHLARGDFFIQLAALIHCAIFWFSPFPWWLRRKLAQLAETASDEAAVLRLNDRATYAEILIEVSQSAQKMPLFLGMAKGPFIQQRVEHILSERPNHNIGLPIRLLTLAALAVLALAVAGAKAIVTPAAVAPRVVQPGVKHPSPSSSAKRAANPTIAPLIRPARESHRAANGTRNHDDGVTYNPRALLDPSYAPKPEFFSPPTVMHAGQVFYLHSTEKPVADVGVTYDSDRRAVHIH
jgi:hypothetical protein